MDNRNELGSNQTLVLNPILTYLGLGQWAGSQYAICCSRNVSQKSFRSGGGTSEIMVRVLTAALFTTGVSGFNVLLSPFQT